MVSRLTLQVGAHATALLARACPIGGPLPKGHCGSRQAGVGVGWGCAFSKPAARKG